jgi:hypothetical protein
MRYFMGVSKAFTFQPHESSSSNKDPNTSAPAHRQSFHCDTNDLCTALKKEGVWLCHTNNDRYREVISSWNYIFISQTIKRPAALCAESPEVSLPLCPGLTLRQVLLTVARKVKHRHILLFLYVQSKGAMFARHVLANGFFDHHLSQLSREVILALEPAPWRDHLADSLQMSPLRFNLPNILWKIVEFFQCWPENGTAEDMYIYNIHNNNVCLGHRSIKKDKSKLYYWYLNTHVVVDILSRARSNTQLD